MTFGGAQGGGVKKAKGVGSQASGEGNSDGIWDGEGDLASKFEGRYERSEEACRKAREWLGLTPRTKSGMCIPDFGKEKELYDKFLMNMDAADGVTTCSHHENATLERASGMLPTERRDTPEDYDIPDLPNLSQPVATRIVSNLEDRASGLSYDSLEAQRSWPSISDFGSEVDNVLPQRGRSLLRTDRVPNLFSRASFRNRQSDATVEVNVRFMEPRLRRSSAFFDDPTEPIAKLEDKLFEPLPRGFIYASVSEVLNLDDTPAVKYQKRSLETALELAYNFSTTRSSSGTSISIDPIRKGVPRFAGDSGRGAEQLHALPLSPNSFLRPFQGEAAWHHTTPLALTIPAEIMLHIYLHLAPVDFGAARQTRLQAMYGTLTVSSTVLTPRHHATTRRLVLLRAPRASHGPDIGQIRKRGMANMRGIWECVDGGFTLPSLVSFGDSESESDSGSKNGNENEADHDHNAQSQPGIAQEIYEAA